MRTCNVCLKDRPVSEFPNQKGCRDGKRPECKVCRKAYLAEYNNRPEQLAKLKRRQATLLAGEGLQRCTKCDEVKQFGEFTTSRKSRFGTDSRCKDCRRKYGFTYNRRPEVKQRAKDNLETARKESPRITLGTALKRALDRRPTENPVTIFDLMEIWRDQNGMCAVSGLQMTWYQGKMLPTSVSIDRINNKEGYSKENVRLICYQANTFRNRWTDAEMLTMAKAIVSNMEKSTEPTWQPHLVQSEAA